MSATHQPQSWHLSKEPPAVSPVDVQHSGKQLLMRAYSVPKRVLRWEQSTDSPSGGLGMGGAGGKSSQAAHPPSMELPTTAQQESAQPKHDWHDRDAVQ